VLRLILNSMRPRQWVKNTVVLAPLVFAQHLLEPADLLRALGAFAIFCVVSGAAYLFNDVRDAEKDRRHETKRSRPVASGSLAPQIAMAAACVLTVAGLASSTLLGVDFLLIVVAYIVLSTTYSLRLKQVVILDVMAVAAGFLLRAVAGAAALEDIEISSWLIICTLFLALFLALGKRRHELVYMNEHAISHRSVLAEYSPQLLDQMIAIVTTSTLIVYVLYTTSPSVQAKLGTTKLFITIPFVLYGIFRYLYLVHKREQGGSPERVLFSDLPLLANVLLWFAAVCIALYSWH
jgi:4-hydroxybenzoate polyprenyltransferase